MLSKEEKRRVDDVYYNFNNGGSYMSPLKVYKVLKSQGWNNPGLHKIRKYIQSLDSYSLQKPVKRSFKRARVEVEGMNVQYDVDLADVSNISQYNDGFRFLLIVIDVFSRFLWIAPVKHKTGKEIMSAFKILVKRGMSIPKKIRSDKGLEFSNRWFKKWCKDNKIYFFTSQNETKANYAERVIKTLKTIMYRYFTKERTYRYINVLQKFVDSYNTTPHTSLNEITPRDVKKENEADLFAYMYLREKKSNKKKRTISNKNKFKLKIGSMVRISHLKQAFSRVYQQKWSAEVFKVKTRFLKQNIPLYQLIDFLDEPVIGNFYQSELQEVEKDENTLWFIEKKIRKRKRGGKTEWFIKFEGWPNKYNQWISENDIKET